jgi:hypothetical protein
MFLHVFYSKQTEKANPALARLLGAVTIRVSFWIAKVGLAVDLEGTVVHYRRIICGRNYGKAITRCG